MRVRLRVGVLVAVLVPRARRWCWYYYYYYYYYYLYLGHADGVGDLERTGDARQRRHLLGVRGRVRGRVGAEG